MLRSVLAGLLLERLEFFLHFWLCVESLAAALDGNPASAAEHLRIYEQSCLAFSKEKCATVRRQMIQIIGGLAQLEVRLKGHD